MPPTESKITVTFLDDSTGGQIGVTQMPPNDLPETFELNTTLHIGETEYSVVSADPLTRVEFARAGSLTVRLRRVEMVDPGSILFSLPSICDVIPPLGSTKLNGRELMLADDDWRQVELVSHSLAAVADGEIEAIRSIHEGATASVGWRDIHVRSVPEPPIVLAGLTKAAISHTLSGLTFEGVSYFGAQTQIQDGFSFTTPDGLRCYGLELSGTISVLGLAGSAPGSTPHSSADLFAGLATKHELDLVNWCRCGRLQPADPLFRELLLGRY